MEIIDQIKQLSEKVSTLRKELKTEEATKSAFIMPFIQILGYDVFNPTEVVPEFVTDEGVKKNNERVDYAIFKDGQPVLIIECKSHTENLNKPDHYTQLKKYFHLTKTRFALLTNGVQFDFYTDIDNRNLMDDKPFLSFDITTIKEQQIKELGKFHKTGFNVESILSTASELKYANAIRSVLVSELTTPSPDFVKYFVSRVYDGKATEKIMIQFTEIVKKTVNQTFKDVVDDKLMTALKPTNANVIEPKEENTDTATTPDNNTDKIVTTEEEKFGHQIVKGILRLNVDINRIVYRDSQTYFSILLDDNNRKPLCRLWLNNPAKKYIGIFDKEKKEIKYEIASIDDIYNYSNELLLTLSYYEGEK